MNYLTFWAARDENEQYRDIIIFGDKEPTYYIDRWQWEANQRNFWCGNNDTDLNLSPGEKQKVKVFIQPF